MVLDLHYLQKELLALLEAVVFEGHCLKEERLVWLGVMEFEVNFQQMAC